MKISKGRVNFKHWETPDGQQYRPGEGPLKGVAQHNGDIAKRILGVKRLTPRYVR